MLELEKLTGNGVVLNTSLNRRGEPMICSPTDALNMFFGSDLQYLVMEDILVVKEAFDMAEARTSTDVVGDIQPVDEDLARIRISASWQRERGRFLRGLGAGLLSVLGALGLIAWLTRHRYLMPPTCIEMIGTAPAARPDA
jgi:hypothetical protein